MLLQGAGQQRPLREIDESPPTQPPPQTIQNWSASRGQKGRSSAGLAIDGFASVCLEFIDIPMYPLHHVRRISSPESPNVREEVSSYVHTL